MVRSEVPDACHGFHRSSIAAITASKSSTIIRKSKFNLTRFGLSAFTSSICPPYCYPYCEACLTEGQEGLFGSVNPDMRAARQRSNFTVKMDDLAGRYSKFIRLFAVSFLVAK